MSSSKDARNRLRHFFQAQLLLPRSEWDSEFRGYIARMVAEKINPPDRYPEAPPKEKELARYLDLLGLNRENLADARVLDCGCGDDFEFVRSCIDTGLTKNAFGIDLDINPKKIPPRYAGNLFHGDFFRPLPVENLDYIVSVGAATNVIALDSDEEFRLATLLLLRNFSTSLRLSGEIRIFPLFSTHPGSGLMGAARSERRWGRVLETLNEEGMCADLLPVDIVVGKTSDEDVALQSTLILRRGE